MLSLVNYLRLQKFLVYSLYAKFRGFFENKEPIESNVVQCGSLFCLFLATFLLSHDYTKYNRDQGAGVIGGGLALKDKSMSCSNATFDAVAVVLIVTLRM